MERNNCIVLWLDLSLDTTIVSVSKFYIQLILENVFRMALNSFHSLRSAIFTIKEKRHYHKNRSAVTKPASSQTFPCSCYGRSCLSWINLLSHRCVCTSWGMPLFVKASWERDRIELICFIYFIERNILGTGSCWEWKHICRLYYFGLHAHKTCIIFLNKKLFVLNFDLTKFDVDILLM